MREKRLLQVALTGIFAILICVIFLCAGSVIITELALNNFASSIPIRKLDELGQFLEHHFLSSAYPLLSLMLTLVSMIMTLYIFSITISFRRNLSLSEKYSNINILFHKLYLDREMGKPLSNEAGLDQTTKIEAVREYVRRRCLEPHFLSEFRVNSMKYGTWEFLFAEELCHGLQDAGVAAISGAIPLRLVLSDAAHVIVEDWSYARDYLKNWRENSPERLHATRLASIPWSRRHGEWLVCVAGIYLWLYWDCEVTRILMSDANAMLPLEYCLRREKELRQNEWDLSPRQVIAEIADIRYRAQWRNLVAHWSCRIHGWLNRKRLQKSAKVADAGLIKHGNPPTDETGFDARPNTSGGLD